MLLRANPGSCHHLLSEEPQIGLCVAEPKGKILFSAWQGVTTELQVLNNSIVLTLLALAPPSRID